MKSKFYYNQFLGVIWDPKKDKKILKNPKSNLKVLSKKRIKHQQRKKIHFF